MLSVSINTEQTVFDHETNSDGVAAYFVDISPFSGRKFRPYFLFVCSTSVPLFLYNVQCHSQ